MPDISIGSATAAGSNLLNMFMTPIQNLVGQVSGFALNLITAIIILIVWGIIIRFIMGIVSRILTAMKLDVLFDKMGVSTELSNIGITASVTNLITGALSILLKLALWMVVIQTLKIEQISKFIESIIAQVPNIVVAIAIFVIGLAVSKFAHTATVASATPSMGAGTADMVGKGVKYAILFFTGMVVLTQVGIAPDLIQTLFTSIVGAVTIASGIAFGLGGKDKAAEILAKIGK